MATSGFSFRDLLAWQRGMDLAYATYRLTDRFPSQERYGLTAQMRKAAVSIPGNIAEGHGRPSTRDYLRFLGIALGSLRELETYFELARRLEFADDTGMAPAFEAAGAAGGLIVGLAASLRRLETKRKG